MKIKLTDIRKRGRYRNGETGQEVNIHKGRGKTNGYDYYFYYYMNNRVFIPVNEFFSDLWTEIDE